MWASGQHGTRPLRRWCYRHHQARGSDCETGSNDSHEKSSMDKLELMSETSQTQKAHPEIDKEKDVKNDSTKVHRNRYS